MGETGSTGTIPRQRQQAASPHEPQLPAGSRPPRALYVVAGDKPQGVSLEIFFVIRHVIC